MNASIAIYSGSMVIYWSSIVIGLGLAACLCLSLALFTANGGRAAGMLLLLPLTLLFSIPLCRALHWYCHMEQYTGFFSALTDYSSGSSNSIPAARPPLAVNRARLKHRQAARPRAMTMLLQ